MGENMGLEIAVRAMLITLGGLGVMIVVAIFLVLVLFWRDPK